MAFRSKALPKINSLYGRIFAIFWFTMFLVLITVLSLPHLDPRRVREVPSDHMERVERIRDDVQNHYAKDTDLGRVLFKIEGKHPRDKDGRPSILFTDLEGNIVTTRPKRDFKLRALNSFLADTEDFSTPQQKLFGRFMLAGPLPITLVDQELYMYIGIRWNEPSPFLLRLFDHPFQLLLAVMAVSTPLLLWLAYALSQPARRLERAAARVAQGEFEEDPNLEKGTSEFKEAGRSFNQMVNAVNQMVSGQQRLLSDISHELRSPLTRLRMANSLAIRKQGDSTELERIDTEAQRLEQMIGELLELSRMQVNSHLSREIQPLNSLWEEILKDAQFEAEQSDKKLTFNTIPERNISGTPKLLMSAFENIVRNAVKYGDDKIDVAFSVAGNRLTVIVDDNGEGVPDSELDSIFRPFYRVSTARDRHTGGTGLGLTITESAIRQHNGSIQASRSPLGGLRMRVELELVEG
ncbi:envelope stress sensor histidine kinase CpxA [Vibrio maerlii]|uniref:envelope stress sensor histidine kinase CpxA n=1 Tax=Vibrio maerlii TaxID=2231648 RepID=UPI000E3C4008|nr:envelope stress sensor histidine kinase CpxA [Vibrio maerlii]